MLGSPVRAPELLPMHLKPELLTHRSPGCALRRSRPDQGDDNVKFANLAGRSTLVLEGGVLDVEKASDGLLPSDPQLAYDRWDEVLAWSARPGLQPDGPLDIGALGAPAPRPRQVFALGLNYAAHARESGHESAKPAPVFTKFPSCLAGPRGVIRLPSEFVDWEVELVVVIGRTAHHIDEKDAWAHVAGLTIGQDISERVVQSEGAVPQFSLGKSYPGFGPMGPHVVTTDEVSDPDDLELATVLNGTDMQRARTSQMLFGIAETLARLSRVCPLWPGDLVFTGTPGGVGNGRNPKVFLRPGDELVSQIQDIGEMVHHCSS
jgi:2,4-didehydro-3-deoxy-L-rhamnonate hydrolase